MYRVNVGLIPGYEVKVTKGTPSILAYNSQKSGLSPVVTFQSPENFELQLIKDGDVRGILTPGQEAK